MIGASVIVILMGAMGVEAGSLSLGRKLSFREEDYKHSMKKVGRTLGVRRAVEIPCMKTKSFSSLNNFWGNKVS